MPGSHDIDNSDVYHFAAPVLRMERPKIPFHYVPVPTEVAEALLSRNSRRVIAEINGRDLRRCLFTNSNGEHSVMVGLPFLRSIRAVPGDNVRVSLWPDPEPERVDLCDEFRIALEQDAEAAERFHGMTTGKQRSISHYPNSAKREETRIKRSLEICYKLRTHTLHQDRTNK